MSTTTTTTAASAFPASKYNFYFRHYALSGQWLRQHGYKGLAPLPFEFQLQSASLPRPGFRDTTSTTSLHQYIETIASVDVTSGLTSSAGHLPVSKTYPKVAAITEKGLSAAVFVPQAEKKAQRKLADQAQPRLQEMPSAIDEDYLRAMEINRRHVADRDRYKYGSYDALQSGTTSWDPGSNRGSKHHHHHPPPPPQVQYVDYCQVETFVTRSVAPSHHGPKQHHGPTGHSTGNAHTSVSGPQTVVKRFTKNPKNRKIVCWPEQLREQEQNRQRRGGAGGQDYDRLYGPANTAGIKARETDLQLGFDRFCDRTQPKLWPQLPVRINFNNQ